MNNKHPLSNLQPAVVWDYFYQLTQIPRPSKHEDAIQAFMLDFGQSLGLQAWRDEIGNIIIKKPATTGYEDRPGVVLQAHLDMVPQANSDSNHDFTTDPIEALVDGDWVRANDTTLGADNGIGVAAIMAVLAATDIEHGPLEALLTCDEETSMTGAFGLQGDVLSGKILLNLDSEDEKELYIGCAGSVDAVFKLPLERQHFSASNFAYQIDLKGLKGGHSGIDIICQRGNANQLLARFLSTLQLTDDWHLQAFNGGNLRNAIPREASAILVAENDISTALTTQIAAFLRIIEQEYGAIEPTVTLTASAIDCTGAKVLTTAAQKCFLATVNACPNGVARMSVSMPGLVETSNNLAIVNVEDEQAVFECLLRSSQDSARDALAMQIRSVFDLAGASSDFGRAYPGWQPNPDSSILQVMKNTGKQLFGQTPKLCAIHAGLECGILAGTYPHWDMISFGPTIRFPHSPDEKVNIASVKGFYDWLVATLAAIPAEC